MRVVCVQREKRFSPNSVDKDLNILSTLVEQLRTKGAEVSMVDAAHLINNKVPAEVIFSMARGEETLDYLQVQEAKGVKVLKPGGGHTQCQPLPHDRPLYAARHTYAAYLYGGYAGGL